MRDRIIPTAFPMAIPDRNKLFLMCRVWMPYDSPNGVVKLFAPSGRRRLNRLVTTTTGVSAETDLTLRQRTPSSPRRRPIPVSAGASPCDSWGPTAHGGRAETGCRPS
jgi:hypothetical protein